MTRTLLFTIPAFVLFTACSTGAGNSVDITIEGAEGRMAYLERFEGGRTIVLDSAKLSSKGQATLKARSLSLDFYRVSLGGNDGITLVMDSTENPVLVTTLSSLNAPSAVSGSRHTEALYRFQQDATTYQNTRQQLRAKITVDAEASKATVDELNALNATFYERTKRFVEEHSSSPVAITALSKLSIQQDLDLFRKVRNDLRQTMAGSTFFSQFRETVDRVEQQELARKLQEEEEKRLANLLPIGGEAPEIRQATPEGGSFALSQLRGKYVLIDFWASWCKPCRFENPAVKRVYDKYKNKGFEILGVSLDRSHDAWVQAIAADGINWKHVSDLGFWNNAAAQEYGVSSIPFTVLLDKEGKIIAKGLRSQQLEAELARIFGS